MRIALLLSCLAMLLSVRVAEATVILPPRGRCERLSFPVLFVGTVQAVKENHRGTLETTFSVEDAIRGQLGPTVVVHLFGETSSCGRGRVAVGEQFLIPAWGNGPGVQRELEVNCVEVWRAADAADDIAFAKGAASRTTGTIEGTISTYGDPHHNVAAQPRGNVLVRAVGTGHSVRTGLDGFYRLLVPPGSYALEIVPDDPGLTLAWYPYYDGQAQVTTRSCTTRDYSLVWNGRIRGRLTDHRGQPAAGVRVHALDTRYPIPTASTAGLTYGPNTVTAADGSYEIIHVQEGTHLVAVSVPFVVSEPIPSTFYPGVPTSASARPVQLARGKLATGIDFQLRAPQPLRQIAGKVRPMPAHAGAFLTITNTVEGRTTEGVVRSDGEFEVREARGAELVIRACRDAGTRYPPGVLPGNPCGPPLKLPPGGDRSITVAGPP